MEEKITREPVNHKKFSPIADGVVIKAERNDSKSKLIVPDTVEVERSVLYINLEVVAYGDLTRYVKVGDIIKLSEFGMNVAPEFLWQEEDESEEGIVTKYDYLVIPEIWIKGLWHMDQFDDEE